MFAVEGCPDQWVAFWSGICKATGLFGTVLGMGFVALLREFLTIQQFYSWGWRVPFLTSIIMGSLGAYLRSFLKESKEFVENQTKAQQQPQRSALKTTVTVWDALHFHWPEIISVALIVAFWATGFYTSFIWMAYYTSELMLMTNTRNGDSIEEGIEVVPHAWLINTVMLGVFVVLIPCAGLVADTVCHHLYPRQSDLGYRRSMVFSALTVVFSGLCCECAVYGMCCMASFVMCEVCNVMYLVVLVCDLDLDVCLCLCQSLCLYNSQSVQCFI